LRSAARALPGAEAVLALPRQRLDHAGVGLSRGLRAKAQLHRMSFSRTAGRLTPQMLRVNIERRRDRYAGLAQRLRAGAAANIAAHRMRIERDRERVAAFAERAARGMRNIFGARQMRVERGGGLLAAFSYRGVLARGFALVRDAAGHPLRTAGSVTAGTPIEVEFADGRIAARVEGGSAAAVPGAEPAKPRQRRDGGSGQGSLF
jgi:exodeoxyribonuclease VII large subunit